MFASWKHKFKIWPRSKHIQSRITKTCTGIKKNKQTNRCTKPAQAPKKTKKNTRCTKPAKAPAKKKTGTMGPLLSSCWVFCFLCFFGACQCFVKSGHQTCTGTKKTKKTKFPGTMGPLLGSCWKFCFFWFFWCLCRFGASSGLVFLVFLLPVNVL